MLSANFFKPRPLRPKPPMSVTLSVQTVLCICFHTSHYAVRNKLWQAYYRTETTKFQQNRRSLMEAITRKILVSISLLNKCNLNNITHLLSEGDSLTYNLGQRFSTRGRDNDNDRRQICTKICSGAWWYNRCCQSNLNGLFLIGRKGKHARRGIEWKAFRGYYYGMRFSEMKMRPFHAGWPRSIVDHFCIVITIYWIQCVT